MKHIWPKGFALLGGGGLFRQVSGNGEEALKLLLKDSGISMRSFWM